MKTRVPVTAQATALTNEETALQIAEARGACRPGQRASETPAARDEE